MHGYQIMLRLTPLLSLVSSFSVQSDGRAHLQPAAPVISRRTSFVKTAALIATVTTTAPLVSQAEISEETPRISDRMGGLLERYTDANKGFSLLSPSGWNKFEGEPGAYDVKWQDVVDGRENIKISTNPVKSTTTSISALGTDIQAIGESLASKRNAKLVQAKERLTDGILFYIFEFAISDGTHQLLCLSVNKGKIWSLDANSSEKRWVKREAMYRNIIGSFLPKLG